MVSLIGITLPKINMAPEINGWKMKFPLGMVYFEGYLILLGSISLFCSCLHLSNMTIKGCSSTRLFQRTKYRFRSFCDRRIGSFGELFHRFIVSEKNTPPKTNGWNFNIIQIGMIFRFNDNVRFPGCRGVNIWEIDHGNFSHAVDGFRNPPLWFVCWKDTTKKRPSTGCRSWSSEPVIFRKSKQIHQFVGVYISWFFFFGGTSVVLLVLVFAFKKGMKQVVQSYAKSTDRKCSQHVFFAEMVLDVSVSRD